MLKSRYLLLLFLIISNFAFSQNQWEVLWDLNTEPDMFQYWIYKGTSQDPTNRIATVNHANDSYIDNQLTKGVLYYYRVTAVDFFLNESGYSVNVSAALPKVDFSTLGTQHIDPGQTITINNLDNYVTDPDNNSHTWTASTSSLTITFNNQSAEIIAPSNLNNTQIVEFTATDSDGFYDIASITFQVDTSTIPNDPPTVANAIANITVNENAANTVIDLSNVFTDTDNDDSAITKSVQNNSNSALVTATITNDNTLTLDYQSNQSGIANITIRGISAGQFVDDLFRVTVIAAADTSSKDAIFAYPVPLNLADDPNAKITFQNIPDDATVLIYNMLGELVYKVEDVPYEWDIENEAGKPIYPGVYLYYVKSGGKKRTGKLVIVK